MLLSDGDILGGPGTDRGRENGSSKKIGRADTIGARNYPIEWNRLGPKGPTDGTISCSNMESVRQGRNRDGCDAVATDCRRIEGRQPDPSRPDSGRCCHPSPSLSRTIRCLGFRTHRAVGFGRRRGLQTGGGNYNQGIACKGFKGERDGRKHDQQNTNYGTRPVLEHDNRDAHTGGPRRRYRQG